MFKALTEANEVLSDEHKRTIYDVDRIGRRMDRIVRDGEKDYENLRGRRASKRGGGTTGEGEAEDGDYFDVEYDDIHTGRRSGWAGHSSTTMPDDDDGDDIEGSVSSEEEEEIYATSEANRRRSNRQRNSGAFRY